MLTKKFFCPVNGWDCPYWKEDGSCSMVDEGDDPVMECDDAGYFFGDDEDSPFVWEDENGNRYDEQELLEQGYHFINGKPVLDPLSIFKSKYIKSWRVGEPLREEDFYEEDE